MLLARESSSSTSQRTSSILKKSFFEKHSDQSKEFHLNIRQYNNMFSFTSMGGKVNHALNNGGGPYTFSLSGQNYHTIGNLLPDEGCRPVFSQLYIHDTANEVLNRISTVRYISHDNSF